MASVEFLLVHAVSPAGAAQNRKALDWIKRLGCQNTAADPPPLFFSLLQIQVLGLHRSKYITELEVGDSQGQSSVLVNPAVPELPGGLGKSQLLWQNTDR